MRSIEARFKKSENKEPYLGAFIHLMRAVRGENFSRNSIIKNFKKLMPEGEYEKSDTKELVDNLEKATNESEDCKNGPKSSFKELFKP